MNHFDYETQREHERANRMELIKAGGLTVFGMVISAEGVRVMLTVGTGLVGFCTALLGLTAAGMGVIYGHRKLKKQKQEQDNDEY